MCSLVLLGLKSKYLDQCFYDAEYGEARALNKIEWNNDHFQAGTEKADKHGDILPRSGRQKPKVKDCPRARSLGLAP